MPEFKFDYLIDGDVLRHLLYRPDSNLLLDGIIEGIQAGRVRTVRQVSSGELKTFPGELARLKAHKRQFEIAPDLQLCDEVQELMDLIPDLVPGLFQQFGSNNPDPADPWLIAVAKVYGLTLVTDENWRSPKRMPMACDLPALKCRCINGPRFFWETKLVDGYDPETVTVHDFYGLP